DGRLIQGRLALLVGVSARAAAAPTDGVDLVHEDDAAPVLARCPKEITHARGADADVHLDEVRARGPQEWHPGLAGDGPREQGLAVPRRADQQDPTRDARADRQEALGLAQELDDLGE